MKKFNKFMWISMMSCLLFTVIGCLLTIYPSASINVISILIAVMLIAGGVLMLVDYSESIFFTGFLSTGILAIILGVVLLIYPNTLGILVPIVIGIWMIVGSIVNMQVSLVLKRIGYDSWLLSVVLSSISILCGILMICCPVEGSLVLTSFFGIILITYSLTAIVNLFMFKKNVNKIVKEIK